MSFRAFPNAERLKDKTVVVTGAASGIGAACAKRYAAEGARVVLGDVDRDGLASVAAEIRDAGGAATEVDADVSDEHAIEGLRDRALEVYGSLEGWHNNAFASVFRPIYEQTLQEFDDTVQVALRAYWYGAKLAANYMLEHDGGVVLNTASVQSYFGEPGFSAYQTVKGGILNLTRSMGKECAPSVRAVAIAPGLIHTPAHEGIPQETMDRVVQNIPAKRGAGPEEVGALAAFLISDEADYITGTGVIIDGGYLAV
jgi:NAD(P)-dependent dehydrogenase (short-subunit alcohol dehydrogenase family)